MSVKTARYGKERWIAYDAASGETEAFETYDEAASWLVDECNDEGIAEETERGLSYIAKVTHRTAMEVTDRKEDYHEHNESCPNDCIEEEWPYDSEFDHVGRIYLVEVDADEPKEERGAEGFWNTEPPLKEGLYLVEVSTKFSSPSPWYETAFYGKRNGWTLLKASEGEEVLAWMEIPPRAEVERRIEEAGHA